MKQKIIAISVLMALSTAPAFARSGPSNTLDSIAGVGTPNLTSDWIFKDTGLTTTLAKIGGGYTLTATATNAPISYSLVGASSFGATGSYTLTANFTASGAFLSGKESIVGTLNAGNVLPNQVNNLGVYQLGDGTIQLFSADLTKFGFNDGNSTNHEYSLGFNTAFNTATSGISWGTQPQFTDFSSGESTYLTGVAYTDTTLKALADAFAGGATGLSNLTASGAYITYNVSSITAVPLPLPAVLFASGLTALLGLNSKSRKQSGAA